MASYIFWNNRKKCWYGWYYPEGVASSTSKKQFSCKVHEKRKRAEAEIFYQNKIASLLEEKRKQKQIRYRLCDLSEKYLADRKAVGVQTNQIDEITSSFRLFAIKLGGNDYWLDEISSELADDFIKRGWNSKNGLWGKKEMVSILTMKKHLSNLKAAFSDAKRYKWICENPFEGIKLNKISYPKPEFLTEQEFNYLISKIDCSKPHLKRLHQICMIAFWTGLRLGEILNMETSDVTHIFDVDIFVHKKKGFTPKWNKERRVPVANIILRMLEAQANENKKSSNTAVKNSSYYFLNRKTGLPFAVNTISSDFKELVRIIFPHREGLHFHSLRHSFGVHHYENGVPLELIKEWMGHKSIRTTEKYTAMRSKVAIRKFNILTAEPKIKEEVATTDKEDLSTVLGLLSSAGKVEVDQILHYLTSQKRNAA